MKYYIGIDGGGSKTVFAIAGEDGKILGTAMGGSAFYKQIGEDGVIELLEKGVKEVCAFAEGNAAEIASCIALVALPRLSFPFFIRRRYDVGVK